MSPIDEKHLLNAQSPYAASKIGADQIALSFYKSFNLPVTTIRPFNTYEPRQSARAVISSIIIQALDGDKINLGQLSSTRDFTFISDTVNGFIKAIGNNKSIGETMNLGSGYEVSINDLVDIIRGLMKKKLIIKQEKNRFRPEKSEVNRLLSNNLKAKKILKWKPKLIKRIGLKEGLLSIIKWFEQNINKADFESKIYNQ
jgi:dTDP-glucose 4,6-dehydratase